MTLDIHAQPCDTLPLVSQPQLNPPSPWQPPKPRSRPPRKPLRPPRSRLRRPRPPRANPSHYRVGRTVSCALKRGTLFPPMLTLLFSVFFLALGLWSGWQLRSVTKGCPAIPNPPAAPQVVVNVPADYKPLDPLMVDGKPALVGPRALLWWTVYCKACDEGRPIWASDDAQKAVEDVYGDTHDD